MTDPVSESFLWSRASLKEPGFERRLEYEETNHEPLELEPNQVLIEIEACGICYRDLVDRHGRFPFMQLPVTPGHEASGIVIQAGKDSQWKAGDRVATLHRDFCGSCTQCEMEQTSLCTQSAWVFGLMVDGGYASHVVAPDSAIYAIPDEIPLREAAVFHCTYGTAWRGLVTIGELQEEEHVVITGANGGVGTAAIQIAKRQKAYVTAITRSETHRAYLQELGADQVLVDDGSNFHKTEAGRSADLVLECVGSPTFNASLRCVRMGGRMVVVGNVSEDRAELNLGYIVVNGIRILCGGAATKNDMNEFLSAFRQKNFDVHIQHVFSLRDAEKAHNILQQGGLQGRMIICPHDKHSP